MTAIDCHKFQLEQINLYGGDVKLFRRGQTGNWQVKIWIRENNKYFRKSLRTRDENLARTLAEDEYLEIKSKRRSGEKIFDITLHKVIDEWLETQKALIGVDKTKGRYQVISSQCNWLKKFISDGNFKIKDVSTSLFMNYYSFRRKQTNDRVQNVTLVNERATINAVFKYAIKNGYLSAIFQADFPVIKKNVRRREALTISEYRTITNFMMSKKFLDEDDNLKVRHFIRDFTLLLSNTGLRFGEARRLKWRHVKIVRGKDEKKSLCEITLSADMTKNRKDRVVQGRRGDVIERIRSYSNYTKSNDFVFVDNVSGNELGRDYYYRVWKFMLKETGLKDGDKEISYYNLRHTYATWRLYAGMNSRALCENLGTGLQSLEQHYGQMKTRMMRDELTKDISDDVKYLLEEE
jgi:integrase